MTFGRVEDLSPLPQQEALDKEPTQEDDLGFKSKSIAESGFDQTGALIPEVFDLEESNVPEMDEEWNDFELIEDESARKGAPNPFLDGRKGVVGGDIEEEDDLIEDSPDLVAPRSDLATDEDVLESDKEGTGDQAVFAPKRGVAPPDVQDEAPDVSEEYDRGARMRKPLSPEQTVVKNSLKSFFSKKMGWIFNRPHFSRARFPSPIGISHKRFNQLMKKAHWGRDALTAKKHVGPEADERVARLATEHPERFAKLFEMRTSPGGPKHGTPDQRHAAYALLYARAAEGASIQELEIHKQALISEMDHATEQFRRVFAAVLLGHQYDDPHDQLQEKLNKQLRHVQSSSSTRVAHHYLPQTRPDRVGWSRSNFAAHETGVEYTKDNADAARQVAEQFPDHFNYLNRELGLSEQEAAYMMLHIKDRLPHLKAPTRQQPEEGRKIDPVDEEARKKFNTEMKKMMAAENYESQSDFAGRRRLYKRTPDVRDPRLDATRAVIYATAMAHPDKVASGEIQPFEAQVPTFGSGHLATIQAMVNKDEAPRKDELFADLKTVADESDRERGVDVA